jgi:hypothetical protein
MGQGRPDPETVLTDTALAAPVEARPKPTDPFPKGASP